MKVTKEEEKAAGVKCRGPATISLSVFRWMCHALCAPLWRLSFMAVSVTVGQ